MHSPLFVEVVVVSQWLACQHSASKQAVRCASGLWPESHTGCLRALCSLLLMCAHVTGDKVPGGRQRGW